VSAAFHELTAASRDSILAPYAEEMEKTMGRRAIALALKLFVVSSILAFGLVAASRAQAACGAVSCFIVIGSQQQIPQKGLFTLNGFYSYTPQRDLLPGTTGIIPEVDQANRRMILNHHREVSTITQNYTLDLNYGVTDQLGFQITAPYLVRKHDHFHFHQGQDAEHLDFSDQGLGDIRITAKYNLLPTLRSMVVTGFGVDFPTGQTNARDSGGHVMEAPVQLGRGNVGLVGSVYQTYEFIPHRLNQFSYLSYRHTFRNNDGYQFGDEYLLNAGFNLVTVPWLVLTSQVNYRYNVHDNFSSSLGAGSPIEDRDVPNTGSTFLAYTPGLLVNVWDNTQFYFFSQIPIARDFNNNLAQGVSYTFGITRYFSTTPSSS
jgi:hypothetical protein